MASSGGALNRKVLSKMDTDILAATSFNQIPRFNEQVHTVATSTLQAIGALFLQHDMHRTCCIGLLHRHFDLQNGQVLIHEPPEDRSAICKAYNISDVSRSELIPHSIFLNESLQFQPYEYEMKKEQLGFDTDFLASVRNLLLEFNMGHVLSIVRRVDCDIPGRAVETVLPSVYGMRTAFGESFNTQYDDGTVVTAWGFCKDSNGEVKILELQECKKNAAGIHDVKPERPGTEMLNP